MISIDLGSDSHSLTHRLYTRLKNLPPMTISLREGLLCLLCNSENIGTIRNEVFMSVKNRIVYNDHKRKGKDFIKTLVYSPHILPKPIWKCHANQSRKNQSYLTEVPRDASLLFTRLIPTFCEEPWIFPKLMAKEWAFSKDCRNKAGHDGTRL